MHEPMPQARHRSLHNAVLRHCVNLSAVAVFAARARKKKQRLKRGTKRKSAKMAPSLVNATNC
jgi:hypothetical protein